MIKLIPTKFGGILKDEKLGLEVMKLKDGYALVKVEMDCIYKTIKGGFNTEEECVEYSNNLITKAYQRVFCY